VTTTVEFRVALRRGNRGARRLGVRRAPTPKPVEPGRIPRVSRLMALAIKIDKLIQSGAITDFAEAAKLGRISRARMSQIANLTLLAPSIIEEVLHLPKTMSGRDAIIERQIRPIAAIADWREQRRRWQDLRRRTGPLDTEAQNVA